MSKEKDAKIRGQNSRLLITVLLMLTIFASILSNGTLAFKTREGYTDNIVNSGKIDIKLMNKRSNGEDMPEIINCLLPGDIIDNVVYTHNECEYSCFVRLKMTVNCYDYDGTEMPVNKFSFGFNKEDWTYNENDDYWYYNHVLDGFKSTELLYNGVFIDKTLTNEYKKAYLDVHLDVEAVQNVNNGTPFTAEGWEVVSK